MSYNEEDYEKFAKKMETLFPEMFSQPYGGFAIGPGWWPIIEQLCKKIQSHTTWINDQRNRQLANNPTNSVVPDYVEPVVVNQIKEKFGDLRFYYEGGDLYIRGLVSMAEEWAGNTCEECGKPGKTREGGWIKTLCDEHEAERQRKRVVDIKYNPV